MSDFEEYSMHCDACLLNCQHRGVSPLEINKKGDAVSCQIIHETKRSCLVAVPVSIMVDITTGGVRTVRVDYLRLRKGSRWKRRRL